MSTITPIKLTPISDHSEITFANAEFTQMGSDINSSEIKIFYYKGIEDRINFMQGSVLFKMFRLISKPDDTVILQAIISSNDNTGKSGPFNYLLIRNKLSEVFFNDWVGEFQFVREDKITQCPKTMNSTIHIANSFNTISKHPEWVFDWGARRDVKNLGPIFE